MNLTHHELLAAGYLPREVAQPGYLRWVKTLTCSVCGRHAPSIAHHLVGHGFKGIGQKAPDILALPLCARHHDELHHEGGSAQWEKRYGSQMFYVCVTILLAQQAGVLVIDFEGKRYTVEPLV